MRRRRRRRYLSARVTPAIAQFDGAGPIIWARRRRDFKALWMHLHADRAGSVGTQSGDEAVKEEGMAAGRGERDIEQQVASRIRGCQAAGRGKSGLDAADVLMTDFPADNLNYPTRRTLVSAAISPATRSLGMPEDRSTVTGAYVRPEPFLRATAASPAPPPTEPIATRDIGIIRDSIPV